MITRYVQCDYRNPCKTCPQQDVMAPDFWKALGCFHGPLTEMVTMCLQGFSSLSTHPLNPPGPEFPPQTGTDDVFWTSELDYLMTNHGFAALLDDFWNKRQHLKTNSADVMDTTPKLTDEDYRKLLRDYGPAVGLLKTTVLDQAYSGDTAYNPFALLRVGKMAMDAMDVCVSYPFESH